MFLYFLNKCITESIRTKNPLRERELLAQVMRSRGHLGNEFGSGLFLQISPKESGLLVVLFIFCLFLAHFCFLIFPFCFSHFLTLYHSGKTDVLPWGVVKTKADVCYKFLFKILLI